MLHSSGFFYNTERFWGRQDFDRSDRGRTYLGIVGDPSIPGGAVYLRDSAGNRNRTFHVYGAQSNYGWQHARGYFQAGVRYLFEQARDQRVNGRGSTPEPASFAMTNPAMDARSPVSYRIASHWARERR